MFKTFIATLMLASSVHAAEVLVLDDSARDLLSSDRISSSIRVDLASGIGYAKVKVTREELIMIPNGGGWNGPYRPFPGQYPGGHFPGGYNRPGPSYRYTTILTTVREEEALIDGLTLVDKAVIYKDENGNDVNCGTMGVSRVFKVPTLFLSGSCSLKSKIVRVNGQRRLQTRFTTK